jgi:Protein of unknown function (DUF2806)
VPAIGDYLTALGYTFSDFMLLQEAGLMLATAIDYTLPIAHDDETAIFTCGNSELVVSRPQGTSQQPTMPLTKIGRELLSLVEKEADSGYLKVFASQFESEDVGMVIGPTANAQKV